MSTNPSSSMSSNGFGAMKLWNNNAERDQHENYASLYAIVKATEALEKSYTRDVVSKAEYVSELKSRVFDEYLCL